VIGLLGLGLTAYGLFLKDSGSTSGETISLDAPSEVQPGGTIDLNVDDGFQGGEQVRVEIDGKTAKQVSADAGGGIQTSLPVAASAPSRTYVIAVTGLSSLRKGSAGVFVKPPPS
jgi:hypothetical protein